VSEKTTRKIKALTQAPNKAVHFGWQKVHTQTHTHKHTHSLWWKVKIAGISCNCSWSCWSCCSFRFLLSGSAASCSLKSFVYCQSQAKSSQVVAIFTPFSYSVSPFSLTLTLSLTLFLFFIYIQSPKVLGMVSTNTQLYLTSIYNTLK